jgi:hypothetical protein
MVPTPRRVDLRLTIPSDATYHQVAGEIAGKFAEYSGAETDAAENLARAVEVMTAQVAGERANGSIALVMEARTGELTVTAESGSAREQATIPLL